MRSPAAAALLTASVLVAASASADTAPIAPAPPVAPPALAAPQAIPVAPASPAPPPYPPAYVAPYMVYSPPGAGAPPYWMSTAPATVRNSNALRTTGIVLFAAGAVLTAVGGVVFGAVATTGCPPIEVEDSVVLSGGPAPEASTERVRSSHQALNGCDTSPVVGAGIIAAGMLTAAVGVPLFMIGSKQVPAQAMTGKLVPELRVGAAGASLRWVF